MTDRLPDVPGCCNARLYIGDDHGDNEATLLCQFPAGHPGRHKAEFQRKTFLPPGSQTVAIVWERCEREDLAAATRYEDTLEPWERLGMSKEDWEEGEQHTCGICGRTYNACTCAKDGRR